MVGQGGVARVAHGQLAGKAGGGNAEAQAQFECERVHGTRGGGIRQPKPQRIGRTEILDLPRQAHGEAVDGQVEGGALDVVEAGRIVLQQASADREQQGDAPAGALGARIPEPIVLVQAFAW